MKVEYNKAGLSHCIEIIDESKSICITVDDAKKLRDNIAKAIEEAEKEPELTEFEIHLLDWLSSDTGGDIPMEQMKFVVKNRAKELLELARKELRDEIVFRGEEYQTGYKEGKAEALKDLPRWKEAVGCFSSAIEKFAILDEPYHNVRFSSCVKTGEYYIDLYDLYKIPKE